MNSMKIIHIETIIIDIPIRRSHSFSAMTINTQAYLILRVQTDQGIEGVGEAVVPGGPWWSGDSIEGMKTVIDTYLTPVLIGENPFQIDRILKKMNAVVAANWFPKAGLEMAFYDIVGKALGVPVYQLLGGLYRESVPITWPLALGDAKADIAEAEQKLEAKENRTFKVKMGAKDPDEDAQYAIDIAQGLKGKAGVRVDINNVWDELTAMRLLPAMEEAGIELIEQPVERWNFEAMARITDKLRVPVMADETICSLQDALRIAKMKAADVLALKPMKSGGLTASRKIAAIAEAAGIPCYGGCFLESSIGTAANVHLCASLPNLTWGSELIGAMWLADDIVEEPTNYHDYDVWVSHKPGLGVSLDEAKLQKYLRHGDG